MSEPVNVGIELYNVIRYATRDLVIWVVEWTAKQPPRRWIIVGGIILSIFIFSMIHEEWEKYHNRKQNSTKPKKKTSEASG